MLFDEDLSADAFFTPLLYAYNTMDENVQIVMGDKPYIRQRDYAGKAMKMKQASDMFDATIEQWKEGNLAFNPELMYKEIFIDPKVDYMTETLRQVAHVSKRIVAVVDHDLMPFVE